VQKLTRHAEVNQKNATAFEPDNYILAAAIERGDPLSHELCCDLGRIVGPRQAGVGDLDVDEAAADELRLKLRADGLDLG
jgi:hypothetical protein